MKRAKIFHTDKKIDKYILGYIDTHSDENCFFRLEENNLTGKRCGYIEITDFANIAESDRGLSLFSNGLLEGVVLFTQLNDNFIIYEALSKHRKFLEKYLNIIAEPGKTKKEEKAKKEEKQMKKKLEKEEKKKEKNTKGKTNKEKE